MSAEDISSQAELRVAKVMDRILTRCRTTHEGAAELEGPFLVIAKDKLERVLREALELHDAAIAAHDHRVTEFLAELLAANNREVERRRRVETALRALLAAIAKTARNSFNPSFDDAGNQIPWRDGWRNDDPEGYELCAAAREVLGDG